MNTGRFIIRLSLSLMVGLFIVYAFGFRPATTTVALITKIVQEVTKKTGADEWKKASKGEPLIFGDQVQTGKKSLAVVTFIDKSIVRVREQSILTVGGEAGSPGSLSKTVQLTSGAFGFDIKKQLQNEMFRLTSPTSVASIRGTMGKMSGGQGNDTLTVTKGLVNFANNISNKNIDVPEGFIAFSDQDGSLTSRKATDGELADANSLAQGGTSNELNLELKDPQGNKKDLKIKFKK